MTSKLEWDVQDVVAAAIELAEERVEVTPDNRDLAAQIIHAGQTVSVRIPVRI